MHRKRILDSLDTYKKSSLITLEEKNKLPELLHFIQQTPACFERETHGHITGSVWLMNHDETEVLLTLHKKIKVWLHLGGHAEGNPDIPAVALREAQEESGIASIEFMTPHIFDIDIHPVKAPCYVHYDIRYLMKTDETAFVISPESHDLAWVSLGNLSTYTDDLSLSRMAYKVMQSKNSLNPQVNVIHNPSKS